MRVLLDDGPNGFPPGAVLGEASLAALYAPPPGRTWLRATMVATVDGSAVGGDDRSGSINTSADKEVFDLLRALSHATLVGAGTARDEGYAALEVEPRWAQTRAAAGLPGDYPIIVVSGRAEVPPRLVGHRPGRVLMVTSATAPGWAKAVAVLGAEHVLACGTTSVDLPTAVTALADRGLTRLLAEGGPHLLADLLAAGLVDELDLTTAPLAVGGSGPRITVGTASRTAYHPVVVVEQAGTVMTRWVR